jgi:hypothetical protein
LRQSPNQCFAIVAPTWAMISASEIAFVRASLAPGLDPFSPGLDPIAIALSVLLLGLFGYGVAVLVTSRTGNRLTPLTYFTATQSARLWFGLAIVLPVLIGIALAALLPPSFGLSALYNPLVFVAPYPIGLGCLLLAYLTSSRPTKAAVVAGTAPSFMTSSDGLWWWDGSRWLPTLGVSPENALRSADGNYWWSGSRWFAMPPWPPKISRRSRRVPSSLIP